MRALFIDRHDAGRSLARSLRQCANKPNVVVLGLLRGGIPVAYEFALTLGASLDVFVVRKLGVPGYEEAALGAIASGGVRVLDQAVIAHLHITDDVIEQITLRERIELERREELYRPDRRFSCVEGQTVILVDDGIATGASMYAAVEALRQERPAKIIVAAPVASATAVRTLSKIADDVVCVTVPEMFRAVGLWYEDFSQTSNAEVRRLLSGARARAVSADVIGHALGT